MVAVEDVVRARAALRSGAPLVQCLTNSVVTNVTANVLLAVGSAPAMVDNVHESAQFAAVAAAVLVNLGTFDDQRVTAMRLAAAAANAHRTPWVLDPVAVGALAYRTALAAELLDHAPVVVRGNASEVMALSGTGPGGRGVDSTASSEQATDAALALARRTGAVVAVSGAVDVIVRDDGTGPDVVRVANGDPMLTRVTGTGCALGALVAAYAAVCEDPLLAAVAAHAHVALAAEVAAAGAGGPGSFATAWLDALDSLSDSQIRNHLRLS